MRGKILFGVALAVAVGLTPRGARACGYGGPGSGGGSYAGLMTAVLAIGITDVALTLWDGGSAVASHHPSAAYGVIETVVAVPQLAVGIAGLTQSNNGAKGALAFYTVWMALLATHGVWTIATARPTTSATVEGPERQAALQRSEPEPQLKVAVGPTYVPVGQLSQPGFGLVGRF
jgi:hypothetical protein